MTLAPKIHCVMLQVSLYFLNFNVYGCIPPQEQPSLWEEEGCFKLLMVRTTALYECKLKTKTSCNTRVPFHRLNPTTGCAPDCRSLRTACLFRYIVQLLQTHQSSSTSDIIRGLRSPSGDRGEESPLTVTWKSMQDI